MKRWTGGGGQLTLELETPRRDRTLLAAACRGLAAARLSPDQRAGRGPDDHDVAEAERYARLAAWIDAGDGDLPHDRQAWPCVLCEADAGQPCELGDPDRFHYQRGFTIGNCQPGYELLADHGTHQAMGGSCVHGATAECGPAGMWRGRCLACSWRGHPVGSENLAVEAVLDHTHPGWRTLPVLTRPPEAGTDKAAKARMTRWRREQGSLLPEGWLDAGGPVRVRRDGRHVPGRAPGGGYDIAAP